MRSAAGYLRERTQLGVKFGLTAMRRLCDELGHPEREYPTLLIAGTNGKGSVAAYVDAALTGAGLRVGRYTSPHLVRVHERITLGGRAIGRAALDAVVGDVAAAADRLIRGGSLTAHPTYFEALTLAAFEHFRRRRVDVAVLEVGMGGRLDATNVSSPLASAIVSIARDHEAFLGRSLAAIAREKAGVLRRGRVCVLGPLPAAARRAIADRAEAVGAELWDASRGVRVRRAGRVVDVATPTHAWRGLRPLEGAHQRHNLAVAVRLLDAAGAAGLRFDADAATTGLHRAQWPGRLEWVPGDPPVLLDGAHNPAAAQALAAYLRERRQPFVLVFGAMADKDVESMAAALFPLARHVVATRPRTPRAAHPGEIARRGGGWARSLEQAGSPRRALERARHLAGPDEAVVVAGSLYLVGALVGPARSRK